MALLQNRYTVLSTLSNVTPSTQSIVPRSRILPANTALKPTHSSRSTSQNRFQTQTNDFNKQTTKHYFKLIQAVHHKDIIDNAIISQTFPIGMMRQVHKLTDFIKPSSPNTDIKHKVTENTKKWMQNNMLILQSHYQTIIHSLTHTQPSFSQTSIQVALGWAPKEIQTQT